MGWNIIKTNTNCIKRGDYLVHQTYKFKRISFCLMYPMDDLLLWYRFYKYITYILHYIIHIFIIKCNWNQFFHLNFFFNFASKKHRLKINFTRNSNMFIKSYTTPMYKVIYALSFRRRFFYTLRKKKSHFDFYA